MTTDWAWLVYMAADNTLRIGTDADLAEMQKASSDRVSVAVQVDLPGVDTERKVLNGGGFVVKNTLPNVDSGSAKALSDFLIWGKNEVPATHYVVDLWSHGNGWQDFTFDQISGPSVGRSVAITLVDRAPTVLFKGPIQKIIEPAASVDAGGLINTVESIAPDFTSLDFLTDKEVAQAFASANGSGPVVDVIACDACYMAMIEVAYEIRNSGSFLVASEDEETPDGWPYGKVLERFDNGVEPVDAAKAIVDAFEAEMGHNPFATLSVIALGGIQNLAGALDALGSALLPVLSEHHSAVTVARGHTTEFSTDGYIDLIHFVIRLKNALTNALPASDANLADILSASDRVLDAAAAAVIRTNRAPDSNPNSRYSPHGIAVYVPTRPLNPDYDSLSFVADAPNWANFVKTYQPLIHSVN